MSMDRSSEQKQLEQRRNQNLALLEYYEKMHKKYPKKRYFVPLAEIYRLLEYFEEATEVLHQGLKRHPGFYIARALLAQIYYQTGNYLQASLEAERVIQMDSHNLLALRLMAKSCLNLGELKKVREPIDRILKMLPEDIEALKVRSSLEGITDGIKIPFGRKPSRIEDFKIQALNVTKNNNPSISKEPSQPRTSF